MEIEATFWILTHFWMVFVGNNTRPRKSKQPFEFWLDFEWLLKKILPDQAYRSKPLQFWTVLEWFL